MSRNSKASKQPKTVTTSKCDSPVKESKNGEYEAEEIWEKAFYSEDCYYLVKWKNYKEATWVWEDDMTNMAELLEDFKKRFNKNNIIIMTNESEILKTITQHQRAFLHQ